MVELQKVCRARREQVCKPNSVSPTLAVGAAIIHLGRPSPDGSSDLPGGRSRLRRNGFGRAALCDASLFGLAPRRVCLATECRHPCWWALTATVSPITCARRPSAGLFSVALVVGSPRLAVSQFAALRCSDFPLALLREPATVRPTPKNHKNYTIQQNEGRSRRGG